MDVVIPKTLGQATISRASRASYFNSSGVMTFAPINTIRVNYDPSNLSTTPSALLESLYQPPLNFMSEGFSVSWTASNATVSQNATIAPDSSNTAAYLAENSTNSIHSIQSAPTFTSGAGTIATFSMFAKAHISDNNDRHALVVNFFNGSGTISARFDLTTATATLVSSYLAGVTCKLVPINNGWYRCVLAGIDTAGQFNISLYNGTNSYLGNGYSGLYIWGAQYEDVVTETSYFPSTQAFVSRATTGTYINSTGLLTTAAINTARINYNPANLSATPKLLLENSSTQLLHLTNNFEAASWSSGPGGGIGIATAPTSPAAVTAGAYTLTDSTGSPMYLTQTRTVTNDTSMYVFSVYIAKTTTATTFPALEFLLTGGSAIDAVLFFNTNTGARGLASGSAGLDYISVQSLPNFWRVSIGLVNNASGNTSISIRMYPAATNNPVAGGAITAGLTGEATFYGPQVEIGASETSYIANTGVSPLTRAADVFTVDNNLKREADVVTNYGILYTNIPENDFPVWNSATTYGLDVAGNNSVIYNHVKYASLQASNTNHVPSTSPAWWSVIGPTNAYAMVDAQVGTQTIGTVGGTISADVATGMQDSINFINVAADTVSYKVYSKGVVISSGTLDFSGGSTGIPITDYSVTGLNTTMDSYIHVSISSTATAPAIGNFVVGKRYYLGSTETSPTIGITDYSIKSVDAFGNPTLTKRGYAKRMNTKSLMDDSQVDFVARILAQVRATPCVWNANTTHVEPNSNKKTSLIVYGYYKDWEIDVAYNTKSYLNCQVEGLL